MIESVAFVQWCLDHLNYWTITLLMTIESSFIPFPSEIVVPPAAYKAYMGEMNMPLIILFASIGALCGALINYAIAYYLGRPIVYKFANSRLGHMCLIDAEKVEKAEKYFDKHGAISTFIGRMVPAIRQLISIPAGLAKMKLSTFMFFTILGASIWNCILAMLGYFLPMFVPSINTEEKLIEQVSIYSHEIGIVIVICVSVALLFVIYKGLKK